MQCFFDDLPHVCSVFRVDEIKEGSPEQLIPAATTVKLGRRLICDENCAVEVGEDNAVERRLNQKSIVLVTLLHDPIPSRYYDFPIRLAFFVAIRPRQPEAIINVKDIPIASLSSARLGEQPAHLHVRHPIRRTGVPDLTWRALGLIPTGTDPVVDA